MTDRRPPPRQATLEDDGWALMDVVALNRVYPQRFPLAPAALRARLRPGDAAKLLFVLEAETPGGGTELLYERLWVVVTERRRGRYFGRLAHDSIQIEPEEDLYLRLGCEAPFGPEHVMDIATPPDARAPQLDAIPATRFWEERA